MTATLGYIALALMAGMAFLAFVTACACVVQWIRFGRETDAVRRELWKHTVFGSKDLGR